MKRKIPLAKFNFYSYPFTYRMWIDKRIADVAYAMWLEITADQDRGFEDMYETWEY